MREMVLANRYAKALVDLGVEEKSLDRFKDEVGRIQKALQAETQIVKILSYRELAFAKREAILNDLSKKLMLSPPVKNLLSLLLKRERITFLPYVLKGFENQVRQIENVMEVHVTVADKKAAKTLSEPLKAALEKMTGKKITFDIKEDKSLIGGVQVRLGDTIYDASLSGELEKIKERWSS